MSTRVIFRIKLASGTLLPDLYFSHDEASDAFTYYRDQGYPVSTIVVWDDEANAIY